MGSGGGGCGGCGGCGGGGGGGAVYMQVHQNHFEIGIVCMYQWLRGCRGVMEAWSGCGNQYWLFRTEVMGEVVG